VFHIQLAKENLIKEMNIFYFKLLKIAHELLYKTYFSHIHTFRYTKLNQLIINNILKI
jgi:hypothetical protein